MDLQRERERERGHDSLDKNYDRKLGHDQKVLWDKKILPMDFQRFANANLKNYKKYNSNMF